MLASITYASPSAFTSTRERADLSLAVSGGVRFHGKVVRHGFMLRNALRALGEVIHTAQAPALPVLRLDPIITVHPDRIWLEAFSQDMSAWCALIIHPEVFEPSGAACFGTAHVDCTEWLWGALEEMRTSRTTWLTVGAEGLEVSPGGGGGRFEQEVHIPDPWLRGFLELQGAMAIPGTRITVRPVDLLSAIRFLHLNQARVSPRALRYELEPQTDARLVIEPWEHSVPLVGVRLPTQKRAIRTWGRRRLRLIEPLLPFAERVEIHLKGCAMPSFYAVQLPGMTFILGLSGHSEAGFGGSGDLNIPAWGREEEEAAAQLARHFHLSAEELAEPAHLTLEQAALALTGLCFRGRAMYDLEAQRWRHRELPDLPVGFTRLYPPDPCREEAERVIAAGVTDLQVHQEKDRRLRRYVNPVTGARIERELLVSQWRVEGDCGQVHPTIVVNADERIIVGQCSCPFFEAHRTIRGPCAHMWALFRLSQAHRTSPSA